MTVHDLQPLLPATAAGLALGVIFFGGLLWTVRKVVSSSWPVLWISASLVLRMSTALAGFYFVSEGDWRRLLACVVGFAAARLAVTWLSRPSAEVGNAP
jgi:F1F0 ATPase subunit 2